jgi:FAD binding domain
MADDGFTLHHKGSAPYARALEVFNQAIYTEPDAVVVPADETELIAAIRAANRSHKSVSVRGGGHGIAGRAIAGDWVIDMRRFKQLRYDGTRVIAGAGLTWQELDEFSAQRGIAIPGGTVSSTGIAGLTLGGGVGWLLPQAGLTCDRLVAVRAVTGDGEAVQLDDDAAPDTMKFLRGFGHGLLAVTQFQYEPVTIPEKVSAGSLTYRISDSREVIERLVDAAKECPDFIGWSPALTWDRDTQILSVDGVSFGSAEFDAWVQDVCKVEPISSTVRLRSYSDAQSMLDNPARWGQRSSWRSVFTDGLVGDAIGFLIDCFCDAPSRGCQIFIERITGMAKVPKRPSAFPLRWANYDVLIAAGWDKAADDDRHRDWLKVTKAGLCELLRQPLDAGTYANYADRTERRALLDEDVMAELANVRARYDPRAILAVPAG